MLIFINQELATEKWPAVTYAQSEKHLYGKQFEVLKAL